MSVTRRLRTNPSFQKLFTDAFDKPRLPPGPPILAPPKTDNYQDVGAAFDYLLRLELERYIPDSIFYDRRGWGRRKSDGWSTRSGPLKSLTDRAADAHSEYLSNGDLSSDLLETCLLFGRYENSWRAGLSADEVLSRPVPSEDIDDLRNLHDAIPLEKFETRSRCLVDFHFSTGSVLLGGADADILIDDCLLDIKTTKKWTIRRRTFSQLLVYYALHEIYGPYGEDGAQPIRRVGVYFSRHGTMHTYAIEEIISPDDLRDFFHAFLESIGDTTGRTLPDYL